MSTAGPPSSAMGIGSANELEHLIEALKNVSNIRAKSAKLFSTASSGVTAKHGDDGDSKKFLSELKEMLDEVNQHLSDLESNLNAQTPVSHSLPLGYSVYLSLDAVTDNIPLYNNLVNSYKWMDKVHDFASGASSLLSQNSLNRSYGKISKNRKRAPSTLQTLNPQAMDNLLGNFGRIFSDMSLHISRPNKTHLSSIIEISLGRVLTAVVILKGLIIEWVVVRGIHEDSRRSSDGQVDVWTESRYDVFKHITNNANAAMLNFQSPIYPELSLKSFMTYLHSYNTLFTDRCKGCKMFLKNNLPPTWREFKTLEPYHEECRP